MHCTVDDEQEVSSLLARSILTGFGLSGGSSDIPSGLLTSPHSYVWVGFFMLLSLSALLRVHCLSET